MRPKLALIAAAVLATAGAVACARAAARRRETTAPSVRLARIRTLYDAGALRYDRAMDLLDRLLFAEGRRWVAARARGDVLELAAGAGRNLSYYPADVRLSGQDLSPNMLAIARRRAAALGRDVDLAVGDAQSLAYPDARFDTVLCTLGLCTIPDERRAVAEAWRVLRPGGRLLLFEHVRSPHAAVRLIQRVLDPFFCLLASDHLLRDPLPVAEESGFEIVEAERHALGLLERVFARRPAAAGAGSIERPV